MMVAWIQATIITSLVLMGIDIQIQALRINKESPGPAIIALSKLPSYSTLYSLLMYSFYSWGIGIQIKNTGTGRDTYRSTKTSNHRLPHATIKHTLYCTVCILQVQIQIKSAARTSNCHLVQATSKLCLMLLLLLMMMMSMLTKEE